MFYLSLCIYIYIYIYMYILGVGHAVRRAARGVRDGPDEELQLLREGVRSLYLYFWQCLYLDRCMCIYIYIIMYLFIYI